MTRAVLTIATGKQLYLEMAAALARSFRLWNDPQDIDFIFATDQPDLIPADLDWVKVYRMKPGEYGEGFSPKLHIDRMSTADATLYIDADCLCVGSLESVFERFSGHAVSAVGKEMNQGEWFGDIRSRCARFEVASIPVFVGALYYFEKGEGATAVFQEARRLEAMYDEIGLVRLRGRPNEEPLISIGMAVNGQSPVPDNGAVKADAMHFPDGIEINVISGYARFINSSGHTQTTSPDIPAALPVVGHFNDSFGHSLPYTREALVLEGVMARGYSARVAKVRALLRESMPKSIEASTKNFLRPLYRRVLGARKVRRNPRL